MLSGRRLAKIEDERSLEFSLQRNRKDWKRALGPI